jgi:prolyl-tRNA synthetase
MFENNEHDLGCVAPFETTLLTINGAGQELCEKIFETSKDIIWDDRDVSYGIKCVEADLIGSPMQIHIGQKELESGALIIKKQGVKETVSIETFFNSMN